MKRRPVAYTGLLHLNNMMGQTPTLIRYLFLSPLPYCHRLRQRNGL